jgi:L-alanine-DL-glutamate epimerase-like enolase superfamily enzyme
MASIKTIETGLYRIPLTVTLSDSTHGEMKAFELITIRVHDSDGAEGVGYTYTVGRNGGVIADLLRREILELIEGREDNDTEAIWHHVWWGLHYGGRGGPTVLALSALDIALWDLKARRANPVLARGQRIAHNLSRADGELIVHDVKRDADEDVSLIDPIEVTSF